MIGLTKKQKEIFNFIKLFSNENGYPPSHHEIKDKFNYGSTNAVATHLQSMERKGFISIAYKVSRGIKLLKDVDAT